MDDHDQQQQQAWVHEVSTFPTPNIGSVSSKSPSEIYGHLKINQPTDSTTEPGASSVDSGTERPLEHRVDLEMGHRINVHQTVRAKAWTKRFHSTDAEMEQQTSRDRVADAFGPNKIPMVLALDTLIVEEHGKDKDLNLLREAYISLEHDDAWKEKLTQNAIFLEQKSPLNNTVLHKAASYGMNEAVQHIAQQNPGLVLAVNLDGDSALHFAARAGHVSTLQKLLALLFEKSKTYTRLSRTELQSTHNGIQDIGYTEVFNLMFSFTFQWNKQGNTFFHEALIGGQKEHIVLQVLDAPFCMNDEEIPLSLQTDFKNKVKSAILSAINTEGQSTLHLAIEAGYQQVVNRLLDPSPQIFPLVGIPPLFGVIKNQDKDMLHVVLSKKPEWIHLCDERGRTAIHYAAYLGFFEGVRYLLEKCASCTTATDKRGFYPHHLASQEGHVEIVDELLKRYSLDPTEIVGGENGQNILHTAVVSGRLNVVNYILQAPELEKLINQKDANGDTPLHLASFYCRPRIVHALTWDKRVHLDLLNKKYQTALDAMEKSVEENPPLARRLTWSALKSAGTQRSSDKIAPQQVIPSSEEEKPANMERYKDRIDTLIVVSTLIITATFAACLTMPGGNSDSDSSRGIANMTNRSMFHLFILSVTISMYGAISVTIILIWSRLGDLDLALLALNLATPLLGVTLATLSLSFMAGIYLVISKLSWLAITFLFLSAVFVFVVVMLYTLLFFPSKSSNPVMRYISYYPFIVLAKVAEKETNAKRNGSVVYRAPT